MPVESYTCEKSVKINLYNKSERDRMYNCAALLGEPSASEVRRLLDFIEEILAAKEGIYDEMERWKSGAYKIVSYIEEVLKCEEVVDVKKAR